MLGHQRPTGDRPNLARFIARRLLLSVPVFFGITLVVFGLLQCTPGDPVTIAMGERADPAVVARVRHELGLDRPLHEQYLTYVWNALHGDFGRSVVLTDLYVADIVAAGLPVSATLGLLAIGIAVLIAVPLGVVSALKRNSLIDYLGTSFAVAGVSVPAFVVAPVLIWAVALELDLLPVAGWGTPAHVLIPAITLGIRPAAVLARQIRQSVVEVLWQDYVGVARAKGLGEPALVVTHVLRNAALPVITVLGLLLGSLVTGTFIVETISAVPGIGNIAVTSIFRRDYPVVMAISLIYAVAYVVANLAADVLYAFADPRIRY